MNQEEGVVDDYEGPPGKAPGRGIQPSGFDLYEKRKKEAEQILDQLSVMRRAIPEVTRKIKCSYSSIIWMNWLAFGVGLVLIGVLVYQLFSGAVTWEYLAAGGAGVLTILLSQLSKPQTRLQRSMFNLARLQTALYAWFSHFINWDVFITNVTLKDKQSDRVLGLIKQSGTDIAYQTKKLFELIEELEDDE